MSRRRSNKHRYAFWPPEEDAIVREHYPRMGGRVVDLLPTKRTPEAVRVYASKHGIEFDADAFMAQKRAIWARVHAERRAARDAERERLRLQSLLGKLDGETMRVPIASYPTFACNDPTPEQIAMRCRAIQRHKPTGLPLDEQGAERFREPHVYRCAL